ncbi:PREDICTED: uncharacterized protein LOC109192125 [Ipomoea nil]|uniref:uncharacterized protein LOC109192125 n=1 Tax=Ipomoea nil TaxID=35883 RepID=UPI000900D287|nr:PREDICTED: uncharacterized protein LOC109192125 [Ipomoea nil]
MVKPESLVSKLLKAKYYPTCDFIDASLGSNPSFIWRSILAGQQVLWLGVARRIGNGMETKIWSWPWLASSEKPSLDTPCMAGYEEATVSRLLTAQGDWDVELIRDIFYEGDAVRILATPVCAQLGDTWRWQGDLRGLYTVRQGYRLLTDTTDSNDCVPGFSAWKILWRLPVPPKVGNLLWRCVRGVLPVKENLKMKQIWIGGGCAICEDSAETIEHLMCECRVARRLWGAVDILQGQSIPVFMHNILESGNTDQAMRLAAIFWAVWTACNDKVWRNMACNIDAMQIQVMTLQQVWKNAFMKYRQGESTRIPTVNWNAPPANHVKCNVDAAIFMDGVGYGAVLRGCDGRFVAARAGRIECDKDPLMAEAIAVKEALTWLKDLGQNNLIIESDCLNFCTAFNSRLVDFSYVGTVAKQCHLIARDIGNVSVRHIKRSANRVAHVLARATGSSAVSGSWSLTPPACISNVLNQE